MECNLIYDMKLLRFLYHIKLRDATNRQFIFFIYADPTIGIFWLKIGNTKNILYDTSFSGLIWAMSFTSRLATILDNGYFL